MLTKDNYDALGHLAWHEGVKEAETKLPILVTDESELITGAIQIKRYLKGLR